MARDRALEVYLDSEMTDGPKKVGTLYGVDAQVRFQYAKDWLASGMGIPIDPGLTLDPGNFYPDASQSNFGVFMDSSPDRWGRTLMDRREQITARQEGRSPRTLYDWDYLIGVQDLTRMGALRFRKPDSTVFLDAHPLPAPPVARLAELEAVASNVASRHALDDLDQLSRWLGVLVAPAASLGGARPKANYLESDGSIWIAKFPSRDDGRDVGRWEWVLNQLAREAGIDVPASECRRFNQAFHTFCVRRFDRNGPTRHFMVSAMTILKRQEGDDGSYLDLLEIVNTMGDPARIARDREQLFRRVLFNVLTGHRDDHLRNHAFLRHRNGLVLSPAYDINPIHDKLEHVLALDEKSRTPSVDTVMDSEHYYELPKGRSREILREVRDVVSRWRTRAARAGIARGDIELTAAAFSAGAGHSVSHTYQQHGDDPDDEPELK